MAPARDTNSYLRTEVECPSVTKFDVIIIGGGPAGMSAGIWCADLGLDALLLERADTLGGQLSSIYGPITNYPGLDLANGDELRERVLRQLKRTNVKVRTSAEIISVNLAQGAVRVAGNEELRASSIIIATGVRRRRLNIPGEREFEGRGILTSGMRDQGTVGGKNVVIVGGGDAALENALILSETASKVSLVHRAEAFRGRENFISRIAKRGNIEILLNTLVTQILGDARLRRVEVESGGAKRHIDCDNLLIRIGVKPNSDLFREDVRVDKQGYILVDSDGSTGIEDTYAVGDVALPQAPTISTAVGSAAAAVKALVSTLSKRAPRP